MSLLSVVMPARDEEACIAATLAELTAELRSQNIPYEIIVVDDGSSDGTCNRVLRLSSEDSGIRLIENLGRNGFGMAIRAGLTQSTGDVIAIMMADASDSPRDLVTYYRKFQESNCCVFGSRFIGGGKAVDYPTHKLVINRLANWFIKVLFGIRYNDITNAFKCYSREAIEHMQPLISPHFNLTVEMPLKAIVRGFPYTVVPITWTNRKTGLSKLKLKEMGSRYLFIVLYLWLEKTLSRGDYVRSATASPAEKRGPSMAPPERASSPRPD
jgi:dolichol-phosphate mannosyltransferase